MTDELKCNLCESPALRLIPTLVIYDNKQETENLCPYCFQRRMSKESGY